MRNGDRADRPMAAHRQTATGLYKKDGHIILRVMRRIKDAAAHHIVATRLEHQPLTDPVECGQEMLSFLAHVLSFQHGAATGNESHRVTTGMGVDTKKGLLHIGSFVN